MNPSPTRTSGGVPRTRRARLAGAAAALAVLAAACTPGDRGSGGTMRMDVLEGTATLTRGGKTDTVRGEAGLAPGDHIALPPGTVAEIRLDRGRLFEADGATLEVTGRSALRLDAGSILAGLTAPATVNAGNAEVEGRRGAFRVDRDLSTEVGVYEGTVTLRGAGQSLTIPALRRAVVAGGVFPRAVRPLRIDQADRWDRRYLQDALELDARLTSLGRGLEAQLSGVSALEFFRLLVPSLDARVLAGLVEAHRRSDLLIGLLLAAEAARGGRLQDAADRVFALRADDASWGLVAHELGVDQVSLFERLLGAIRRAGIVVGGRGPAAIQRPAPAPAPSPTGGRTPSPAPGPTEAPTPTPTPSPSPRPSPTADPVEQVIEDLLGILPAPTPGGSPGALLPLPLPSPTNLLP